MSPEDDHLQGEQVTGNSDRLNHDDHWSTPKHVSPKNNVMNSIGNNGYISNNAILKQNGGNSGGDSNAWLPLLSHHHANDIPDIATTNNNKWPNNISNSKYVWRDLPQDDDSKGLYKPNALTNGNGLNGKSEHESLTGVVRHPIDDYANDEFYERSDCGIGVCKPKWARMFASTHVFMVIFLLAWILQVIIIVVCVQYQISIIFFNEPQLIIYSFWHLHSRFRFRLSAGNVFYVFCECHHDN